MLKILSLNVRSQKNKTTSQHKLLAKLITDKTLENPLLIIEKLDIQLNDVRREYWNKFDESKKKNSKKCSHRNWESEH